MLQRLTVAATVDEGGVRLREPLRDGWREGELEAVEAEDVRREGGRVVPWRLHAGLVEDPRRPLDEVPDGRLARRAVVARCAGRRRVVVRRHASPAAARRAASSASMADCTTGASSPPSTASRL